MYKYNNKKDSFEFVNIINDEIFTIFELGIFNNSLIIATERGLLVKDNEKWKILVNKHSYPEILNDSITHILVDSKNYIWFSIHKNGLWTFIPSTKKLVRPQIFTDYNDFKKENVQCIYEDINGDIYIGTLNNSFYLKKSNSTLFKNIIIDQENKYSYRVNTFFRDNRNRLFIGTRNGLYLYRHGKFFHYAHIHHPYSKLSNNSILCNLIDKNGILWIGTHFKGVNYVDLYKKPFIHFYSLEFHSNLFLNHNVVYCFAEDKDHNLYIGTENGINIFSLKNKTFDYIVHNEKNPNSLSYNDVKSIVVDKYGNLWIGTNLGGLNYYNIKTKSLSITFIILKILTLCLQIKYINCI